MYTSFYLLNQRICNSSELSFHFVAKDRPDKYCGEICLLINLIIVIIYKEHYMIVIQSQIHRYANNVNFSIVSIQSFCAYQFSCCI